MNDIPKSFSLAQLSKFCILQNNYYRTEMITMPKYSDLFGNFVFPGPSAMGCRDHFMYAPNQWEMMLQCNVVSHWLGVCKKWSLGMDMLSPVLTFKSIKAFTHTVINASKHPVNIPVSGYTHKNICIRFYLDTTCLPQLHQMVVISIWHTETIIMIIHGSIKLMH